MPIKKRVRLRKRADHAGLARPVQGADGYVISDSVLVHEQDFTTPLPQELFELLKSIQSNAESAKTHQNLIRQLDKFLNLISGSVPGIFPINSVDRTNAELASSDSLEKAKKDKAWFVKRTSKNGSFSIHKIPWSEGWQFAEEAIAYMLKNYWVVPDKANRELLRSLIGDAMYEQRRKKTSAANFLHNLVDEMKIIRRKILDPDPAFIQNLENQLKIPRDEILNLFKGEIFTKDQYLLREAASLVGISERHLRRYRPKLTRQRGRAYISKNELIDCIARYDSPSKRGPKKKTVT